MTGYVVTGASRGLGEAIARCALERGGALVTLSRSENRSLAELARSLARPYSWLQQDLARSDNLDAVVEQAWAFLKTCTPQRVIWINNAGMVSPVAPLDRCARQELVTSLALNLSAPMLLSRALIRTLADQPLEKWVVNISSGAARNPYAGWCAYCSGKAALNMFTRCAALEQETRPHPLRFLAFAPGVVDTGMQHLIRDVDLQDFPQRERFRALKEQGQLLEPGVPARILLDILDQGAVENGAILDVRDLTRGGGE